MRGSRAVSPGLALALGLGPWPILEPWAHAPRAQGPRAREVRILKNGVCKNYMHAPCVNMAGRPALFTPRADREGHGTRPARYEPCGGLVSYEIAVAIADDLVEKHAEEAPTSIQT